MPSNATQQAGRDLYAPYEDQSDITSDEVAATVIADGIDSAGYQNLWLSLVMTGGMTACKVDIEEWNGYSWIVTATTNVDILGLSTRYYIAGNHRTRARIYDIVGSGNLSRVYNFTV